MLDLVLFYLDDGVVCGSPQAVSEALATLQQSAAALGLSLNLGKCELVAAADTAPAGLDAKFPAALLADDLGNSRVLTGGNFEILGAPVGSDAFCAGHAESRCSKILPALDALPSLEDPQVALRILRRCHGFSKLAYTARVVPCDAHAAELGAHDAAQRKTFTDVFGFDPSESQ